jgi:DNA modification methylase
MNTPSLPAPYLAGDGVTVYLGECGNILAAMEPDSVDACITDPPYGLGDLKPEIVTRALAEWLAGNRSYVPDGKGFMSRDWDKFVPPPAAWDACYRVMKPGAYLLAFAAPRTADLMGISIRLAGFEVHDSIHWITGQGFPKAKSRLKPAHEPIIMARKPAKASPPLPGLEGCAVGTGIMTESRMTQSPGGVLNCNGRDVDHGSWRQKPNDNPAVRAGRWPPNLLLTHSADCEMTGMRRVRNRSGSISPDVPSGPVDAVYGERERTGWQAHGDADGMETVEAWDCVPDCPVAGLDAQSGVLMSGEHRASEQRHADGGNGVTHGKMAGVTGMSHGDVGGASRFFPQFAWSPKYDLPFMYCAKAPSSERPGQADGTGWPTVKPLDLMKWLARLVTPPGGTVLDLFAGTGTTGQACFIEGFPCILIEKDPAAAGLIRERLSKPVQLGLDLGGGL